MRFSQLNGSDLGFFCISLHLHSARSAKTKTNVKQYNAHIMKKDSSTLVFADDDVGG